jgi:lysophospholipase L1-like esterase
MRPNRQFTPTKLQAWGTQVASMLALLLLASMVGAQARRGPSGDSMDCHENWVGTWSTALHAPDLGVPGLSNIGFNNQTLRQIVHTSIGGNRFRVRFSTFGADALVIGEARIGRSTTGGAIEPGSDRPLTFGGKSSITVPPGALVVTDAVELESPSLGDLAISVYVPGQTSPASWHFEGLQTSYISQPGNFTSSTFMPVQSTETAWFWLVGVDVLGSPREASIVTFGDSLTDGTQSTADANHRWPDQLAQRLITEHKVHPMGVLNEGLAGNRLLHDSLGPNALARFDRDVLSQTEVTDVIVLYGAGDISNPFDIVSADEIIQGHKQLIERAHAKHLKIFGGTLTPNEGFVVPGTSIPAFNAANEAKRQAVNAWIRSSAEYDGLIDFDRALRDPSKPTQIFPAYDSGDHGHPNDDGYKKMSRAIDLSLFGGSSR